jgi:hypothetical protein
MNDVSIGNCIFVVKIVYNNTVLGNNSGVIQILNISSGEIEKEFSVHTTTVR